MGAELIGVMKAMLQCLTYGRRFVLTVHQPPRGWLVPGGWSVFFTPHFAVRPSRVLDVSNRPQFPIDSILYGAWRGLARSLLATADRRARWMFDRWETLPGALPVADLGREVPFPTVCQWLLDVIWDLRGEVRAEVDRTKAGFCLRELPGGPCEARRQANGESVRSHLPLRRRYTRGDHFNPQRCGYQRRRSCGGGAGGGLGRSVAGCMSGGTTALATTRPSSTAVPLRSATTRGSGSWLKWRRCGAQSTS